LLGFFKFFFFVAILFFLLIAIGINIRILY
jgi:hypothetical protein